MEARASTARMEFGGLESHSAQSLAQQRSLQMSPMFRDR